MDNRWYCPDHGIITDERPPVHLHDRHSAEGVVFDTRYGGRFYVRRGRRIRKQSDGLALLLARFF